MATRKVKPDKLSDAITDILNEYQAEETITMDEAVKKVSKAGAKELRAASRRTFGGTGQYAKGWTSTVETGDHSAQGTIYNEKVPGLPHLLEHGHAKRGGGRTEGRPHIKPIEEQVVAQFEEELMNTL